MKAIRRLPRVRHRYDLPLLPGLAAPDAALKANAEPPMGDLTEALDLSK